MKGSTWYNNMGLPTFTTACEGANLGSTQFESECVKWHPCEKGNRLVGVGEDRLVGLLGLSKQVVSRGGGAKQAVSGGGANRLLVEGEGQTGC